MATFAAIVVVAHSLFPDRVPALEGAPFTLIGIALSIFLAFRNNASYERWWEGRKLWGQLIHVCRAFARQTLLLSVDGGDGNSRPYLLRLAMAFVHSLVAHLRGKDDHPAVGRFLGEADLARFMQSGRHPSSILQLVSEELVRQRVEGRLTDSSADRGLAIAPIAAVSKTPSRALRATTTDAFVWHTWRLGSCSYSRRLTY